MCLMKFQPFSVKNLVNFTSIY